MKVLQRTLTDFDTKSQCGEDDDSQNVELYDGTLGPTRQFVDVRQPSTGQIQWKSNLAQLLNPGDDPGNVSGERWCSGTLIADRFFLTAGHCLDVNEEVSTGWKTPRRNPGNVAVPPSELAKMMHVNFNYQINAATGLARTADVYPIANLTEHRRGGLDYAILELGPGADATLPSQRYSTTDFDVSPAGLTLARQLTVIQHPNGVPKRIAAGTGLRVAGNLIFYSDIDTLGGSSGAGVINQTGRVVGVHTNGGCTLTGGENFGVTLRAISQFSAVIR